MAIEPSENEAIRQEAHFPEEEEKVPGEVAAKEGAAKAVKPSERETIDNPFSIIEIHRQELPVVEGAEDASQKKQEAADAVDVTSDEFELL